MRELVETVSAPVPTPSDVRVTHVGLKAVPGPGGETAAVKQTLPVSSFRLATVTVDDPDEPSSIVKEGELASRLKSGGCVTVTVMVAVCIDEPLVPAMVIA